MTPRCFEIGALLTLKKTSRFRPDDRESPSCERQLEAMDDTQANQLRRETVYPKQRIAHALETVLGAGPALQARRSGSVEITVGTSRRADETASNSSLTGSKI